MLFSKRPEGLEVPTFDSFRRNGASLTRAEAPANETLLSMPSQLTGLSIAAAIPTGASKLMVTSASFPAPVSWGNLPNIFSRSSELGVSTAVVGWYHPYCRIFTALDFCSSVPVFQTVTGQTPNESKTIAGAVAAQLASISPLSRRSLAIQDYKRILADAERAISKDFGLIFLHFPIPHEPVIYDRSKEKLTVFKPSNIEGYVDNLSLTDLTLAKLLSAIEKNSNRRKYAVIVSSDHMWRDAQFFDGRNDPYVPFIVVLSNQSPGITLKIPFQTIHTQELVLSILRGELNDNSSVARWIVKHSSS